MAGNIFFRYKSILISDFFGSVHYCIVMTGGMKRTKLLREIRNGKLEKSIYKDDNGILNNF